MNKGRLFPTCEKLMTGNDNPFVDSQFCALCGQTVVTLSTSTYRTELSLCQQITSFSSNVAVSMELSDFKRVCSIDVPRNLRRILLRFERNIFGWFECSIVKWRAEH